MDETTITRLCLAITITGMLLFAATYKEEYTKKTISEVLEKEGNKGIIFGKVEYVIKNYPVTIFILNDGNKTTVYHPKPTTLEKNAFVTIYAQSQLQGKEINLYAQKVKEE